jgi:hypothetical protein
VVFLDAINVKVRDGKVANRPIYVALAVTVDGGRDILGLWAGDGGEGAKFWLHVLTEIKNRGVQDVCILVCDGLKGIPDAVGNVWPLTLVQTCVIHLLRNSFRYAPRQHWEKIARDLKADLHRPQGGRRGGEVRGVRRDLGRPLPGHREAVAVGVGGVRAVPGLRRRDTQDHLHHRRHRVPERPLPPRGPRQRTLPDRAGCTQVPLPGDPITGPHRPRQGTLGDPLEGRPERLRHHLRWPPRPQHHQLTPASYTEDRTVPGTPPWSGSLGRTTDVRAQDDGDDATSGMAVCS